MSRLDFTSDQLIATEDQRADFVELFFDLVFVFAITKVTHLTAEHIDIPHIFQSLVMFWLIWLTWVQFTWTLNIANTGHPIVTLVTLISTAIAFVMAAAVDVAFDGGVMWFALSYIALRALGYGFFIRVTPSDGGHRAAATRLGILSLTGLVAVMGGALADPSYRAWWWFGAIILDLAAAFIGGRAQGWEIRPRHFAERHGLIMIIALGESLIVAAVAVAGEELSKDLIISGLLAVAVICLLWWSYFGWIQDHLEERLLKAQGRLRAMRGRDIYSFGHFPLIVGIIGIAIGFEKILGHPHDPLSTPATLALGGGFVLYIGFTAVLIWLSSRILLAPRLIVLLVSVAGIFATIGRNPNLVLGVIAVGLIFINIFEWKMCRNKAPIDTDADGQVVDDRAQSESLGLGTT